MTLHTGIYVAPTADGTGTTPKDARLSLGGLLMGNSDNPLDIRTGILADSAGDVVTGTSGMEYAVRPFVAVTKASNVNGPTIVANDSTETLVTDPAPGANSRIDTVYVRQRLIAGDGGSELTNVPELAVAIGDVAALPTPPQLPPGALDLGSFTVTANAIETASLAVSRTHGWTVARGGIAPVSAAERDGLVPWEGLTIWNTTAKELQTFDGATWKGTADTGWIDLPLSSTYEPYSASYPCQYRIVTGVVYIRGLVKKVNGTNFILGTEYTLCTLPVGARPSQILRFSVSGQAYNEWGSVRISTGGVVTVIASNGTAPYMSLTGAIYPADN